MNKNKNSATMKTMEYVFADYLKPDQLMEGDFIKYDDESGEQIIKVDKIFIAKDGYIIEALNDFDEMIEIIVPDDYLFAWYVLPDE